IPFRVWGPKNSSHNGRKSKGITPDSFGAQPPPSPHNPPSPLPPSRGEAASSNNGRFRVTVRAVPSSPRTGQSSCGTRHLPSAIPDSEFGDPELGPLGMRHMLRNATFFGFFENLENRVFDASYYSIESCGHWTKRLRRGMGGAGWVVAQDGRDLTVERVGCDTLGFPAVVAGDLWPPRTKGYHDVRTEKPSDPGHAARRAG